MGAILTPWRNGGFLTPLTVRRQAAIGDRLAALQGAGTTIVTMMDIHLPDRVESNYPG